MSFNNLPASIQAAIQTNMLKREFDNALRAKLGFRDIADKVDFPGRIGETLTSTRAGLFPPALTPLNNSNNNDLTSGITPKVFPIEQYTVGILQYGDGTQLNVVKEKVAIASVYLTNASRLGEQASRTLDLLARNALFGAYTGGATYVNTALTTAGPTISVDDNRSFSAGLVVSVNGTSYSACPI